MTRINSNVNSLIAQRVLGQNNQQLSTSLERLSTGLKINRAADGPAGLIASQNLRAEQSGISSAISNAERADQVVNIAEGGLNEVSSLLTELQGLVTTSANTAGLSDEEKEANQLQIDSILQTIDRLAESTSFQGEKLLNGTLDFETNNVSGEVENFQVNGAKLDFEETRDVNVNVTASAQQAALVLSFGAAGLGLANDDDTFQVEIAGSKGSRELTFAQSTSVADITDAVNTFTDVTGVSASVSGANDIRLDSTELGSDEFVSVTVIDDAGQAGGVNTLNATDLSATLASTAFASAGNGVTDDGQDVEATINGVSAVGDGATASINTEFLDISVELSTRAGTANAQNTGSLKALEISGGGADFQLAGDVNIAGKESIGIGNVAARELGRTDDDGDTRFLADLGSGKALNVVDGDTSKAQEVLKGAIKDVSSLRGRLGAFQSNTVGATIRSLGVSLENSTAAESIIRDADFASETASLTRSQILSQSATQALQQANNLPQNALALLG